ncbi:MAG: superoxide dismutase [Acidobacteria bacterium]|jgi:Fe-Mn family superoxide dismutase|nr:superoxide dismutase [Acidobacteriota bacterium]
MEKKPYVLPQLGFGYKELEPFISEAQLQLHHQKHHAAYVNGANTILETLDKNRREGVDGDLKALSKAFSFNAAGHLLHSLFWENLAPAAKTAPKPEGLFAKAVDAEFGGFERFKKEFSQTAITTEGSGWAALVYCRQTNRPLLMQIEKHNTNVIPMFRVLLVLDVWEHAYYLDYKNDRAKFVEGFWNIVNWTEVNARLEAILK